MEDSIGFIGRYCSARPLPPGVKVSLFVTLPISQKEETIINDHLPEKH